MRLLWIVLIAAFLIGCARPAPSVSVLTITTASLPPAAAGEIYAQQLMATGGTAPYKWSMVSGSLPTGVTLSLSGSLAGRPTESGSFTFVVQVIDSAAASAKIHIGGWINEDS